MRKEQSEEEVKGSITVEASIIMSIIIFVLFSFILLTLWLRDRVVTEAVICEAAENGRHEDTDEISHWIETELKGLYAAEGQITEMSCDENGVNIGWSSMGTSLYPGGSIHFKELIERSFYDPPSFLRMCRIAEQLMDQGEYHGDTLSKGTE